MQLTTVTPARKLIRNLSALISTMHPLRELAHKFVPSSTRLAWSRSAIQRGYGKDIAAARRAEDLNALAALGSAERWELELQAELEDDYLTSRLMSQARRLRVPTPHFRNRDGSESDSWYKGSQTGGWALTTLGVNSLRHDIRLEKKSRHESLAVYLPWLTAVTGVLGTITGLVAVLMRT